MTRRGAPTTISLDIFSTENPFILEAIRSGLIQTRASLYTHIERLSEGTAGKCSYDHKAWFDSLDECRVFLDQIEEVENCVRKVNKILDQAIQS